MIKSSPSRQPIRRTPQFAACGLAAVAIVAAGVSVCAPTSSTHSAPTVHSTSVEGTPSSAPVDDDLTAVASIPRSDHITHEHVTNVLRQHRLLEDWFCPCLLGAEPQSWACVKQRDKARAIELLTASLKGTPFRGSVGSVKGRMKAAPWKSLAANVSYNDLLKLPEFAPSTSVGRTIRKHGNVFDAYSFGFQPQPATLPYITQVSRLERKYFGKRGWGTASEYRVNFASARKNPKVTAKVRIQIWNKGKSVEWHQNVDEPTPDLSLGDQRETSPLWSRVMTDPKCRTAFVAASFILVGPLHAMPTFRECYPTIFVIVSERENMKARELIYREEAPVPKPRLGASPVGPEILRRAERMRRSMIRKR